MLKLNISRIIRPADPAYPDRLQDVASFQLPDDPAIVAQVVAAVGDILVKHNDKPKPGGGAGEPIQYVPVVGGGQTSYTQAVNKPISTKIYERGSWGAGFKP